MNPPARAHRGILSCILLGIALRLALAAISIGTNDAGAWHRMAQEVEHLGLLGAYQADPLINHPPLPLLWARFALIGQSPRLFSFIMKLPAIAGDGMAIWLLGLIWAKRDNPRRAIFAALAMALSPIAILISGYHCNTDNLYAALALLAMYLISDRGRFFLAGLALAAAINVKLIPILLIPGAYSLCPTPRAARRLSIGLAIGAIPFTPLIISVPDAVQHNMLNYSSIVSDWGIPLVLHELFDVPRFAHAAKSAMDAYLSLGKIAVVLSALGLSIWNWRRRRFNGPEIGLLSMALFLVLAPGFSPQYLVAPVPLLLAVGLSRSWIYGLLGGTYLAIRYSSALVSHGIPLETEFQPDTSIPQGSLIGLLAWGTLLVIVLALLIRRRNFTPGCL